MEFSSVIVTCFALSTAVATCCWCSWDRKGRICPMIAFSLFDISACNDTIVLQWIIFFLLSFSFLTWHHSGCVRKRNKGCTEDGRKIFISRVVRVLSSREKYFWPYISSSSTANEAIRSLWHFYPWTIVLFRGGKISRIFWICSWKGGYFFDGLNDVRGEGETLTILGKLGMIGKYRGRRGDSGCAFGKFDKYLVNFEVKSRSRFYMNSFIQPARSLILAVKQYWIFYIDWLILDKLLSKAAYNLNVFSYFRDRSFIPMYVINFYLFEFKLIPINFSPE